ncbi:Hypothetical_protein [Hexamita inflata]|uniref:Hypothetical_protein n=1 Tax=Hexamita inflata TaxID=28002 RepID=A0AA86NNS6_9EUKA|nr:Hypothetical protein HINF_LOCUS10498 [Hexamita inflata]
MQITELQPMISLLVEQSHAFKMCQVVLDFIIYQKQVYSCQGSNYILSDGSRCGKTTFDLCLFVAHLFHPDLTSVPVMVQNIKGSLKQPLAYCQNLVIDSSNFNNNYIKAVREIDVSTKDSRILSVNNLIQANITDFIKYPAQLFDISSRIHRAVLQQNIVKSIIQIQLKVNPNISNSFLKDDIKIENSYAFYIYTNTLIIKLCTFISAFRNDDDCSGVVQLLQLNNDKVNSELKNLFLQTQNLEVKTKYLGEGSYITPNITQNYLVILDEVCNRKKNEENNNYITAFEYSKIFQLINIVCCNDEFVNQQDLSGLIEQFAKYPEFQQHQIENNKALTNFIKSIPNSNKQLLLLFPLSIFIKNSENIDVTKLSTKEKEELMNVFGFEAVMLRDLSNQLHNLRTLSDENNRFLTPSVVLEHLNMLFDTKCETLNSYEYQKQCSNDGITTVFSGTDLVAGNCIGYSTNLKTSSGSRLVSLQQFKDENRNIVEGYIHTSLCGQPQYHPSILTCQYYIDGINSVFIKENDQDINFNLIDTGTGENWRNNILNLMLCCNTNATGFIQTIFAQVTPQLIIQDDNQQLINESPQQTYMGLLSENDYLNKINPIKFKQIFIAKVIVQKENIKTCNHENKDKFLIRVKISGETSSKILSKASNQIFIQPLTSKNMLQLANVVNEYINMFEVYLKKCDNKCLCQLKCNCVTVQFISQLLINSENMLGGRSTIQETLSILLILFQLKHGFQDLIVNNLEQIFLISDVMFNPSNEKFTHSKQHYCGKLNKNSINIQQYSKQTIIASKTFLTVIQPQFVQNNCSELYIPIFNRKNLEASKVVADSILKTKPNIDMVIVAIPVDQGKLQTLAKAENNQQQYSGGPSKCFFELGRRMKFII